MDGRAIFLDRDGVINVERNYVHRPEQFEFIPGSIEGMKDLNDAGYDLVVITNQAGIARGLYSEADYRKLNEYMLAELAKSDVKILDVYHCPHHPDPSPHGKGFDCNCRKPKPGMILKGLRQYNLDATRTALIGDKISDVSAGRASDLAVCILVESGHPVCPSDRTLADVTLPDLRSAADWLLSRPVLL